MRQKPDYYLILTADNKVTIPDHLKDAPKPPGFPQGLTVWHGDREHGYVMPDSAEREDGVLYAWMSNDSASKKDS